MTFKIEVDDFYMEEGDLASELKRTITNDVTAQIRKMLEAKIEDGITKEVKAQVEQTLYRKIVTYVGECIANDKVKGRYSGDPEVTLQEWVKLQFTETAKSKAPVDDAIKKLAVQFGDELKKRYDLLFASQLVAKLSDGGLLKEDAVKLLLNKD
jgi:hypothetical protein